MDDDEIDLMELFRALWRGKWLIMMAAAGALFMGGYYAFSVAEPQYRSSATLTVEMRTNQVVDIESVISGASTETAALNTEIEIILSRRVLGKLVDELSLIEDPEFNSALRTPSGLSQVVGSVRGLVRSFIGSSGEATEPAETKSARDATINAVRSALSASVQRDTYVFSISATTGNARKSARIVNTLAEQYIEDQIAVKFEATEQAAEWLSTRVSEIEEDLREREDTLTQARSETDLISAEALEGLNLQAKDLRSRLSEMRERAAAAQNEADRLRDLRASGDNAALVEETNDQELRRLLEAIRSGDDDAEEMFDQRVDTLVSDAESQYGRLRGQVETLAQSYQNLQDRIERQSEDLARIEQMVREVEATRTLYETLLTRLKETNIQRGLQRGDSRVLSEAILGQQIAPRTSRILALSLILGAMGGAAIVLLRQFMHNTFRTADDLEAATGLPVFGQIPRMPIKARKDLISYLRSKPTSASAEAIRNLRTSLLLSDIDNPPKVILSTSALPSEGKTTHAIALALNLAGLDKKVLLIEGDIRRQTLGEYFDGVTEGGILTALSGEVPLNEVVFHDDQLGADVLMGEKSRVNAADLFSSDRFSTFLERAREAYDFVIIDTPPVLVVPDARVIGQNVDAILFSVAWDNTQRGQVSAALRELQSVNLRVTGIALAQIDPKGMRRYGYGGKYGAYGAYGKGYYEAG
ncbi:GumC family protein [Roseovarius sp.]|uniref:GumC family protein n=1 Tax=Roseovarius sp. TaxID=1486281 RepID=UPI0035671373